MLAAVLCLFLSGCAQPQERKVVTPLPIRRQAAPARFFPPEPVRINVLEAAAALENLPLSPEKKVCEVHGAMVRRVSVPVVYGLITFPPEILEAQKNFPNAGGFYPGGCVSIPNATQEKNVPVCSECEEGMQKAVQKLSQTQ